MKKIPRPSSTSALRNHEPLTLPQVTPETVDGDKRPAGADDPVPGPGEDNLIGSLPRSPAQEVGSIGGIGGAGFMAGTGGKPVGARITFDSCRPLPTADASSLPVYRCEKGHTEISLVCGRCGEPMDYWGSCCNTMHPPIYYCASCECDAEVTS
jgi:hypothetical protein